MNNGSNQLAISLTIRYALLQGSYWMSFCITTGFATVFLKSRNFNNSQIGIVIALGAIFSVILQPIIATFADKTKKIPLRIITVTLMLISLSFIITLFLFPFSMLLTAILFVLIYTIQLTMVPFLNSLALEFINMGISINYGLARGMGSISFAIISFILGILIEKNGPWILLPFLIIIYCLLISFTFTFKLSKNNTLAYQKSVLPSDNITVVPHNMLSFIKKYKKFMVLLLGVTMLFIQHNMINTYMIQVLENVGGNNSDLGLALSIAAAVELPTMAFFIFFIRKFKCSTLLRISATFFTLKAIVAWLAPNVFMILFSQSLQFIAFALFTTTAVYYVNRIIEDQDNVKGQTLIGLASMGLGGTIGSLLAGQLLDRFNVHLMLGIGVIISFIGCCIMFLTTDSTK